jgi:hypothetical protein
MQDGTLTLKRETLDRSRGQNNVEVQQRYVRSGLLPDEEDRFAAIDQTRAKMVHDLLTKVYRGHFWEVYCDSSQGILTITIPILLNNYKWIFKLQDEITPAKVIRAGGEILERFNIPRGHMDVAAFVQARQMAVPNGGKPPE